MKKFMTYFLPIIIVILLAALVVYLGNKATQKPVEDTLEEETTTEDVATTEDLLEEFKEKYRPNYVSINTRHYGWEVYATWDVPPTIESRMTMDRNASLSLRVEAQILPDALEQLSAYASTLNLPLLEE